jgi:hemolysin III
MSKVDSTQAVLDSMYYTTLPDGGPVYCETDLSHTVVEPLNAFSAFLFLFIVWYWFRKIKHDLKGYAFLGISLLVLFIGGVGGTLYHAFRIHQAFLLMDYLPILILAFSAGVYFFIRIIPRWWIVIVIFVLFFLLQRSIYSYLPPGVGINVGYAVLAIFLLYPIVVFSARTNFLKFRYILYAIVFFAIALFFRVADMWQNRTIDICTHWLWHIFGGLSSHLIIGYVYYSYAIAKTRVYQKFEEERAKEYPE